MDHTQEHTCIVASLGGKGGGGGGGGGLCLFVCILICGEIGLGEVICVLISRSHYCINNECYCALWFCLLLACMTGCDYWVLGF